MKYVGVLFVTVVVFVQGFVAVRVVLGQDAKGAVRVDEDERQSFNRGNKVAVVVGIENYLEETGFPALSYAVDDAQALADFLSNEAGYRVRLLSDHMANKNVVMRALEQAGNVISDEHGTALFFFSGHGVNEGGVNYLATYDAIEGQLKSTGLSINKVKQLLAATGARRRVLFVDACRSEAGKSGPGRGFLDDGEGDKVLYSTGPEKRSFEDSTLAHGVFTYYLLEGLRGGAATEHAVTFDALADFVGDKVAGWSFSKGRDQRPHKGGDAFGRFVVAQLSGDWQVPTPVVPRPAPTVRVGKREAGARWSDPGIGMVFRYIPAGTFWMGSPASEAGREDDEQRHKVRITRGYWMGETEVTQGQWKAVMASNPSSFSGCGEDCPVESVSWFEAVKFANALSNRAGYEACYGISGESVTFKGLGCRGYRLPTESEWEYAARSGAETLYAGGDDLDPVGWYDGNSGGRTHRVGQKRANAWGLYDMSGNVWEWVWDRYEKYPRGMVSDPTGPSSGSYRVKRGGDWYYYSQYCRSAYRGNYGPSSRDSNVGFRLARSE